MNVAVDKGNVYYLQVCLTIDIHLFNPTILSRLVKTAIWPFWFSAPTPWTRCSSPRTLTRGRLQWWPVCHVSSCLFSLCPVPVHRPNYCLLCCSKLYFLARLQLHNVPSAINSRHNSGHQYDPSTGLFCPSLSRLPKHYVPAAS